MRQSCFLFFSTMRMDGWKLLTLRSLRHCDLFRLSAFVPVVCCRLCDYARGSVSRKSPSELFIVKCNVHFVICVSPLFFFSSGGWLKGYPQLHAPLMSTPLRIQTQISRNWDIMSMSMLMWFLIVFFWLICFMSCLENICLTNLVKP